MSTVVQDFVRIDASEHPGELQRHCRQCTFARGRLHWCRCALESAGAFVTSRFISVLVVLGLIALAGASLPLAH
jgi:hypothetical protein